MITHLKHKHYKIKVSTNKLELKTTRSIYANKITKYTKNSQIVKGDGLSERHIRYIG